MIHSSYIGAGSDTPVGQFPPTPSNLLNREYYGNGSAFGSLPISPNEAGGIFVYDWWNYGDSSGKAPSTAAGLKYSYLNPEIYREGSQGASSISLTSGTGRGIASFGSQLNTSYQGIIVTLSNSATYFIRASGNPYTGGSEVYGLFAVSPQGSNELIFGVARIGGDFAYDVIVYPATIVSMQVDQGAPYIIRSVTDDNFVA
jgi:hypothetical protein